MSATTTITEPEDQQPRATAAEALQSMTEELPVIDEQFRTLASYKDDYGQRRVLAILERTNLKLDLTSLEIMDGMRHEHHFDIDHPPESYNQFTLTGGPSDPALNADIIENSRHGIVLHLYDGNGDMFIGLSHSQIREMRDQVREEEARPGSHMREAPIAPFPDGHGWAENNADRAELSTQAPKL
ncbi:MAG: hypothetical protein H6858_00810 [Rhodospirillales bacterium]|nr:hypothetical protein [Alphaproteobacteria bacterium]MCB9976121.1 hypothetical protein [Rhodospirillales bacterium]